MYKGKTYSRGLIALVVGGVGLCEPKNDGAFLIYAILFAIGFALICWSYVRE